MMREPLRYQTRFGSWVADSGGASRVAEQLALVGHPVTPHAVFKWVAGAHYPKAEVVFDLVKLSGGRLGMADVLMQRFELARLREEACGLPDGPADLAP